MAYKSKKFIHGEILTHGHLNNIIEGIDELKSTMGPETILKLLELPQQQSVDLFVFAGQSNMMGAAYYPPDENPRTYYAFEYKYQRVLKGDSKGEFVPAQHPAGDWHYKTPDIAYNSTNKDSATGKSKLTNYANNTYFVSACSNEELAFANQSELNHKIGSSIAPYFARYYAQLGNPCIYAHMAKGSTSINHYLDNDTWAAFTAKYNKMLEDYANFEPDKIIANKCLVWLQGESDDTMNYQDYLDKLGTLWSQAKALGFTYLFILRVGYWGNTGIINIMKAQEDFCKANSDCYIVTRAPSLVPYPGLANSWWITTPSTEYNNCRDSLLSSNITNQHFNEKGHKLFAKRSADNINRILHFNLEPILEEENVKGMV